MSNLTTARWLFALLAMVLLLPMALAQDALDDPPQFNVFFSHAEPEVGERTTLVVTPPEGLDVTAMQGQLEGLRVGAFERQTDGSFVAIVHALRSGVYGLEEMTLTARLADGTNIQATLAPSSFIVPDPDFVEEKDDYTGLLSAPRTLWPTIIAGVIIGIITLALLAVAIWLLRRWLKARATAAALPTPLPDPIDEAFDALISLEELHDYRTHGTKAHYLVLSMLLRRYIERQWHRPAMEMSEDEVTSMLRAEFSHRPGISDLLKVLATASLAKFARLHVALDDVQAHLQASRAFLTSEHDRLRAAEMADKVAQRNSGGREAA